MTFHHIVHVEGLNALNDLVQMIYEELKSTNTRATIPVVSPNPSVVINGSDPEVQKALNTPDKAPAKMARNRWTSEEEEIVLYGYANGWSAKAISHYMGLKGYTRSPHAIVDHKSELMKRSK